MERKTIYIMCGSVIGIFLVLLLVIWIMSLTKTRTYDYQEVENLIVEATGKYYKDNPIYLPTDDGNYNLSFNALVTEGYIKPLNELLKDGDVCSVIITVVKKNDSFTYIPQLNCGEKYSTVSLADHIINSNSIITEGEGLYKGENNDYYFKGKVTNNYVAFGTYTKNKKEYNHLWRIIGIENGKVKLVYNDTLKTKTAWDTRYNSTENKYVGYNDFDLSILAEYLKKLETDTESFLGYEELAKIEPTNLCVGPRKLSESITNGRTECSVLSKDKFLFDTLNPYDYMRASLDEECTVATSYTCTNLNYLSNLNHSGVWTVIPSDKSNYEAFTFDGSSFELSATKYNKNIAPVILLNEYTFFESGLGTSSDPYMIK